MDSPERVAEATRSFLEDHPDAEAALEEFVAIDEAGPWTFDDVPMDSGRFGELVSRDIATKTDDGDYRLANRDAVLSVVDAEHAAETSTPTAAGASGSTGRSSSIDDLRPHLTLPDFNRRASLGLLGALLVVALARLVGYAAVFRDGDVVSPGNDPYYYRYWQRRLLDKSNGVMDPSVLSEITGAGRTRPLTHATNWWFTELLSGSASAADTVAAWLPVVAAVFLGVVVYLLATRLTGDARIGLASVVLLGVAPVHAVYTSAGFLEHRAHQYLWLGVLALALTWLATDLQRRLGGESSERSRPNSSLGISGRSDSQADSDGQFAHVDNTAVSRAVAAHTRSSRSWAVASILAVAVPASIHTWGGSPLVFVPVAAYLGVRVVADVRAEISPARALAPTLGGLAAGAVLGLLAHVQWGWHDGFVAVTPLLVAAGGVAVVALATVWQRLELPALGLIGVEIVTAVSGFVIYRSIRPGHVSRFRERADDLLFLEGPSETASLFTPDQAFVFGPLTQLGLGFYLAIIPLGLATWLVARRYEPGWLVPVCFTWWFLVLAAIQVRFAAQLAIFVALFGGIALVYLLSAIDLARRPATFGGPSAAPAGDSIELPDQSMALGYIGGILCLVLLFNLIFVPGYIGELTYDDGQYGASQAIEEYDQRLDHEYPENFVLSEWGHNRMYNFFVNEETSSYLYAQNNHETFLTAASPDNQYNRINNRVGYVVLEDQDLPENTVHSKLYDEYGAGDDPVAHYQLVHADGGVRAFAVVEGATIRTTAEPETTIAASTNVSVDDASFTYERATTTDANGTATLRVAYPGEYEVGDETVTVTLSDVHDGRIVSPDAN